MMSFLNAIKLLDSKIDKGLVWKDMKEDISKIIGIFIMGETMAGINSVITRTAECNLDTGELFGTDIENIL